MFDSSRDYLDRKAEELNLGRGDDLGRIQAVLDALYPGLTHAISLNDHLLKVVTPNASAAQELRLRQVELIAKFNGEIGGANQVERLNIQIRGS